jgi:cytoskeletal protein CcmA (bactofilin family)
LGIYYPSTLLVAVSQQIALVNGALPGNVYWLVGSSATLGVNSVVVGNIIATASITINTGAKLNGRAFAVTAAVTLDTDYIVASSCNVNPCLISTPTQTPTLTPTQTPSTPSPIIPTNSCPTFGIAGSFAVFAASTSTSTGQTIITGDMGLYPGTSITGFPAGIVVYGTLYANVLPLSLEVKVAIQQTEICLLGSTITSTLGLEIGGTTLTPGNYTTGSSLSISTTLTLDAAGNPNAYWVFNIPTTLLVAVSAQVVLVNGALPGNVYWLVGTSATLGVSSVMVGNIIATASITINTGAKLNGRAFALTAAVTLDTNNIVAVPCTINLCHT